MLKGYPYRTPQSFTGSYWAEVTKHNTFTGDIVLVNYVSDRFRIQLNYRFKIYNPHPAHSDWDVITRSEAESIIETFVLLNS